MPVFHPRLFDPSFSPIPSCFMSMNAEQTQKEMDRNNEWMARHTELKGKPEYFSRVYQVHYAQRRLAMLKTESMDKEQTYDELHRCNEWIAHNKRLQGEPAHLNMMHQLRFTQDRLLAIVYKQVAEMD